MTKIIYYKYFYFTSRSSFAFNCNSMDTNSILPSSLVPDILEMPLRMFLAKVFLMIPITYVSVENWGKLSQN